MLSALRLWAAGLALILTGCRDSTPKPDPEGGASPPVVEIDAEGAREEERPTPADFVEPLALAAEAYQAANRSDFPEAVRLYRATLEILPADASSREPEFVARVHDALGRALQDNGSYDDALFHLDAAWQLRVRLHQADEASEAARIDLGISEGHLGMLELLSGRYAEADRRLHDALRLTPDHDHALLAHRHDCLGRYHLALRSPQRAAEHFAQAIEEALQSDPDPSLLADLRANLALCQFRAGDPEGALTEIEALLSEEVDGPEAELQRAEWLNLSGTILAALDRVTLAEERIGAGLEIVARIRGGSHLAVAIPLANLAAIRHQAGNPSGALEPLREARAILRTHVSDHHQALVEIEYQIAACALDALPLSEARAAVVEARQAAGNLLAALLANGTERELLNFRNQIDLHTIVCRLGEAGLIAQSLLDGKDRVMEAVLDRRTRRTEDADRLRTLQTRLDLLLLDHPAAAADQIAQLRDEIRELSSRSLPAPPPADSSLRWQDVRDALGPGTACIDCVRYLPSDSGRARYGAVLLLPGRDPQWVPLGEERLLRYRLRNLHDSLQVAAASLRTGGDAQGLPMTPLLATLSESFWQPIAAALPADTREVIVCPEGELHLLPYAVLRSSAGRFLCEEIDVLRLLPSARTLASAPPPGTAPAPWAILGVTDFTAHRALLDAGAPGWTGKWADALEELDDLPTVGEELRRLKALAPTGSVVRSNHEATLSALRALPASPEVLHLASHGFHVPLEGDRDLSADPSALYESGLLLGLDHGRDGILFPEAAGGLHLQGTTLVTLSTCRSALGRPITGEGLLGFRRAFAKAGARNILASLWEIPDRTTADFMARFYREFSARRDDPARLLWALQATEFSSLRDDDPTGPSVEHAILSYGGFLMTSPGGR